MAEAGVPHPDGPHPERPEVPERPGRPRGGRDPVALAAWRRVAEQRRRSAGGEEPLDEAPHVEAAPHVDVPEPTRSEPAEGAVLRDPTPDTPREAPATRTSPPSPSGDDRRPDDGPPSPGRLHEVLLGLAGRIDDDALTAVREMVAAEDDAEAAELLGGCLLADEVGLSPDERGVLAPWFAAARVDPDLLAGLPVDPDALRRSGHRFVPTTAGAAPAAPLARAARRLSGVVSVRESWRVTPAGAAPGPVPHRVVLVETAEPDDCDHVVHHLAHAARGLGGTSVEVFASEITLPAYHRDALAAARPLGTADPLPTRTPEVVREDGETWRTVADAGTSRISAPPVEASRPESPVVEPEPEPAADEPPAAAAAAAPEVPVEEPEVPVEEPEAVPETSIDDDLSLTARRIAALWARPVPEDFSAPLPPETLESTRLEPTRPDDDEPVPAEEPADGSDAAAVVDEPVGRHGRTPEVDPGTDAFLARPPRPAPPVNGHHLGDHPTPDAAEAAGEPTPPEGTAVASVAAAGPDDAGDDAGDDADRLPRARHRGARPEDGGPPTPFGHDARYGAGSGPAWPGAPVTGDRPGPERLFTSPVEIGEEPVTLGTNGHRHDAVPATPPDPDEPATGPVAWAAGRTTDVTPTRREGPAPRAGGDVAPPWAADAPAWPQEQAAWTPPPTPPPTSPAYRPGPETPPAPAKSEVTGAWSPDTDDSVAQLSDRERELLARLHEELAQRERAEGTDPFAGPAGRPQAPRPPQPQPPQPPRPAGPPPERRNGQGPHPGRTNGHGLPGGPDPAS
ncbi:hypothetical protein [Actinomycetospora sp. CA-084318]|uniref:hypothetical protein n=1 Tax=Actinomycetospora sp. CA-084318 TaxID=3239892 RepID=UPI003D9696DA